MGYVVINCKNNQRFYFMKDNRGKYLTQKLINLFDEENMNMGKSLS